MATHNDVTGDALVSKRNNDNYRNNYDRIFDKKKSNVADYIEYSRKLNSHPEYHIPEFGGLGKTLCGIMSYTLDARSGKPLCQECQKIEESMKEEKSSPVKVPVTNVPEQEAS